jgi:hypothetical protein
MPFPNTGRGLHPGKSLRYAENLIRDKSACGTVCLHLYSTGIAGTADKHSHHKYLNTFHPELSGCS